jgi:hypothetical protein
LVEEVEDILPSYSHLVAKKIENVKVGASKFLKNIFTGGNGTDGLSLKRKEKSLIFKENNIDE